MPQFRQNFVSATAHPHSSQNMICHLKHNTYQMNNSGPTSQSNNIVVGKQDLVNRKEFPRTRLIPPPSSQLPKPMTKAVFN